MCLYFFASGFDSISEAQDMPIRVSTPIGYFFMVDLVYQFCVMTFVKR